MENDRGTYDGDGDGDDETCADGQVSLSTFTSPATARPPVSRKRRVCARDWADWATGTGRNSAGLLHRDGGAVLAAMRMR